MFSKMFGFKETFDIVDDSVIPPHRLLPTKFSQHILNFGVNPSLRDKIRETLAIKTKSLFWGAFTDTIVPEYKCKDKKDHIRTYKDLDGWVIKFHRQDLAVGEDTFLYRVRKAHKIQGIIDQKGWKDRAVVPKKYLYFHPQSDRWYVIAEKLELNEGIQSLQPFQALIIAYIMFKAHLVDVHWRNVTFDLQGRIAFCDTEPTTRKFHKKIKNNILVKSGLIDYQLFKQIEVLQSTNYLKIMANNILAVQAVNGFQQNQFTRALGVTVSKVLAIAAIIYFMPTYVPISSVARVTLSIKIITLAAQIFLNYIIIKKNLN